MNILHIGYSDIVGGAARGAYRLHCGLRNAGHRSEMLVLTRRSRDPAVKRFEASSNPIRRAYRALRRAHIRAALNGFDYDNPFEPFSDDRSWLGTELGANFPECDIVNLHWVSGMVDWRAFLPVITARVPVVWTLHDMNPFTGGCHYDAGCRRFFAKCGACPLLKSKNEGDLSRAIWQRKHEALASIPKTALHLITASEWMAGETAQSSLMGGFPVRAIPYGLDPNVFAPRDRSFSRHVLGIPENARVILFVCHSIHDSRKGFKYLKQAIESLENVFLLSLGSGDLPSTENSLHVGFVEQDRLMSLIYSAADVFVIPSLQEAFGQTGTEAMACCTPVVGFDVGGIPEFVRSNETGFLVPPADVRKLAEAIEALLSNRELRDRMGRRGRESVLQSYTLEGMASQYLEVYNNMLDIRRK